MDEAFNFAAAIGNIRRSDYGRRMKEPFFTIFAAVLAANLLTVSFVVGLYRYSQHERDGTAGQRGTNRYAIAGIAPLAILAVALMIAFDKVPVWLDTILQ